MKKVNVLMSTYNGEKYLSEQLDSILNQKEVEVIIDIRDDGSKDSTINIINEYVAKDSRIKLHTGKNVGPIQSFFSLLEYASPCDYYAFCDQDDYWESNKLLSAVEKLEEFDNNRPLLYCSNLKIVDKDLQFCRLSHSHPVDTSNKYCSLVDFNVVGCTQVFNKSAKLFVLEHLSSTSLMHDSWMYLLCSFFGKVVYDNVPHILYRQHSENVIGSKTNTKDMITDSVLRLFDSSVQPRLQNASALLNACGSLLNDTDLHKVKKVVFYKKTVFNRIKLLFDFDIKSNSIISDIKYRILIVLGLI